MIRKSHVYSTSGRWSKGRLNQTFDAILFPDDPAKKQYVHGTLKGKCDENYDMLRFIGNCLDWVADESDAFGFTREHKNGTLKINIIEGKK